MSEQEKIKLAEEVLAQANGGIADDPGQHTYDGPTHVDGPTGFDVPTDFPFGPVHYITDDETVVGGYCCPYCRTKFSQITLAGIAKHEAECSARR